ncbi:hypothetical protein [Corynebacterium oculi]|uniref:Uncharacterized protein n=1 Tax=Corynebacterium oculi TaxID=1544416 RepID=A0A0Q1DXI9_9CORY|nr:hypothetical protein [Corynebacterium oculi]KQB84952.1 hypothetical protein Cocul_00082 [Corynebacterium oculi]
MSIRRDIALRLSWLLVPDETIQRILRQHHREMMTGIENALASQRVVYRRDGEDATFKAQFDTLQRDVTEIHSATHTSLQALDRFDRLLERFRDLHKGFIPLAFLGFVFGFTRMALSRH